MNPKPHEFHYRRLLDLGFENKGKDGIGLKMVRKETVINFCVPCGGVKFKGRLLKFGSGEFGEFMFRQSQQ